MRRFFTSDHHFFHKNILKYEALHRPFYSVDEMNRELILRWNQVVAPTDEVYYLGDLTFDAHSSRAQLLLDSLNGTKYLIQGNHDPNHLQECGFKWMKSTDKLSLIDQEGHEDERLEVLLCHYPYMAYEFLHMNAERVVQFDSLGRKLTHVLDAPIDEVIKSRQDYQAQRQFLINYYGTKINAQDRDHPDVHKLRRFLQRILKRITWRQPRPEGKWLIHGHVHGLWQSKPQERMINVSVEAWNLTPVPEQALVDIILTTPQDKPLNGKN